MAVAPIGAVTGIQGVQGAQGLAGTQGAGPAGGKLDFAAGLQAVEQSLQRADALGTQVATGQIQDLHEFTAAAAKANLAVELTVAVRNKAVEAYQEIMRMQI